MIGTAALRDPEFLDAMLDRRTASAVVVSVDARGGKVSLAGWTETSEVDVAEAVADLSERGVERFLFTADRGRRHDGRARTCASWPGSRPRPRRR